MAEQRAAWNGGAAVRWLMVFFWPERAERAGGDFNLGRAGGLG